MIGLLRQIGVEGQVIGQRQAAAVEPGQQGARLGQCGRHRVTLVGELEMKVDAPVDGPGHQQACVVGACWFEGGGDALAGVVGVEDTQALRRELDEISQKLSDRKLVDKAKGVLMKARGIDEDAAYHAMRKLAMERGQTMAKVARDVIDMARVLL